MRRFFILFALLLCFVTLSFAITPADGGKWITTGTLLAARQDAGAVALPDGRMLVTGGRTSDGSVLSSTEIIQADGGAVAGPMMSAPRAGHTATLLPTGNVLIVGGDSGAGATVTAEVFNSNTNVFTPLAVTLNDARTGHVAALDGNGNVTIIGGMTANGPVMLVESFNTTTQQFVSTGRLMYSRSQPAIAAFKDGRVLIAGGLDANGVTLASIEIFDPSTGAAVEGPMMNVARAGASATLQIDGNIIVIGGTTPDAHGNAAEVASGELVSPYGTSTFLATVLNVARAGHMAFLLPDNSGVLLAGGHAAGADLNTAELYKPWTGTATLSTMAASHASGAGVAKSGVMAVAGGTNQTGIELFGFPTIKTDQADYAPGTAVWMTGSGWLPGEAVSLYMQAIPSTANVAPTLTTTAGNDGKISDGDWAPDVTDIGARFYLTAVGATSGWQAQTTFTDGAISVTVTGNGSVTGSPALTPATCTSANSPCTASGGNGFSDTLTASLPAVWTLSRGSCNAGTTTCTLTLNGSNNGTATVAFGVTLTSISPTSATYGATATTLTATGNNFANGVSVINFNGTDLATTCSSATTCTATIPAANLTNPAKAGTLLVYVHNSTNNSGTQNFTLNKRAITVSAVTNLKTYDGTTTASAIPVISAGTLAGTDSNSFSEAYDNPNVGTTHVMTVAGAVNDGNGGANYTVTKNSISTGAITAAPVTVTASSATVNYGGAVPTITPTFNGLVNGETSSVLTTQPTCSTMYTTTSAPGSSPSTSCSGAAATNYSFTYVPGSVTVNKATVTVTASSPTVNYGDAVPTITPTFAGFVNGQNSTVLTTQPTCSTTYTTTSAAGSTPSTSCSGAAAANYAFSYVSGNVTVSKRSASVTPNEASKTYGVSDPTFTGTLSGFVAADSVTATYSRTAGESAGGTYTISATLNPASVLSNYNITYNTAALTINKANASVTPNTASKTYGTSDPAFAGTLSGFVAGDNVTATYSRTTGESAGGTYTIGATLSPAGVLGNYNITYNTASLTINQANLTVNANSVSKTFDGAPYSPFTVSYSGFVNGDNAASLAGALTFSGSAVGATNKGAYQIMPAGLSSTNYSITFNPGTLTIDPAAVTATAGGYTGGYDGNAHFTAACTVSGAYTAGLSCANNPIAVGPLVGSGTVTAVVSGPTSNFTITPVDGTYSITQAPANIVLGSLTQTYDGSPKAASVVAMTNSVLVTYTGIAPTNYPTNATPPTNPGNYTVTATSADPNYFGTQTGTLVINQLAPSLSLAILTGMPNPSAYGGMVYYELSTTATPCPTGQVQFYVDNAAVGSPVTLPTGNCTQPVQFQTAILAPGAHAIYAVYTGDRIYKGENSNTVQHTVDANTTSVTLASTTDTLSVGQSVTFTATISPTTSADSSVQAPSGQVTFLDSGVEIGSGTLSATAPYVATFSTTSLPVGPHSITASYVSGDGLYTGSSSAVVLETVNKIVPDILWTPPATSFAYGTKISSEMLNATATVGGNTVDGTFTYDVSVNDVLLTGTRNVTATFNPADTATYTSPTQSVTFTVTPAILTVTADDQSRTYGATNPTFTYQIAGFVNGDNQSVVSGTPNLITTAGMNSAVGSYPITVDVSPLAAANYTFAPVNGHLNVTRVTLTVTADSLSKNAGAANPTLTVSYSGFMNGDTASVLSGSPAVTTTATTSSPVGSYSITVDIGTLSATNYTFTFVPGTLTIDKAIQVLSWPTPAPINSNVALSATQLNATAAVPGTFTYNPPAGTMLSAGNQTLSVTFTPTDQVDFGVATASVTLVVYQYKGAAAVPVMSPPNGTFNDQTHQVTITDASGAPIYYTTDGSYPTTNSNLYTGPITVTSSMTIRAYAIGYGYTASPYIGGTFNVVASVPMLSPASGNFNDKTHTVTLTCTSGAPIYYTTDNSTPTANSKPYTGPITVSNSMVIRAIAVGSGYAASSVSAGSFTLVASTPVMSPTGGTYKNSQQVTMTDASGAPIYYTTDGSTPTTNSKLYTGPFDVTNSETIRVFATGNGFNSSAVYSGAFTITK